MLTRKELNAKRKVELMEKLKIGAFVKNVWGATMRRVDYYEIVAIDRNKVAWLRRAAITGDPSPNCTSSEVTLVGPSNHGSIDAYADIRMGYLVKQGESIRDYWSTYEFCNIGDKTQTWSD